jgi:hypothetical protein
MKKRSFRKKQTTTESDTDSEPTPTTQKPKKLVGLSSHLLTKKPKIEQVQKFGLIKPKPKEVVKNEPIKSVPKKKLLLISTDKFNGIQQIQIDVKLIKKNKEDLDEKYRKMLLKGYNRHSLNKPKEKQVEEVGFFKLKEGKPIGVINYAKFKKRRF